MPALNVRRLLIDLESPFPTRWNGGDAFRTAFFNALSMSFPVGEQYFIDSVRQGFQTLPATSQERFACEVKGFIGQEATHRRIHQLFNQHLQNQGFHNAIEQRALRRIQAKSGMDLRVHVGATAATEHLTALFANWMLSNPEFLSGAQPRLQLLWQWHSAEESEHSTTAFDIYQAMGGGYSWRVRLLRYITVVFLCDLMNQTLRNLWQDGSLFKASTWMSAYALLLGKKGLLRTNYKLWRAYFSQDFHPQQQENNLSQQWLRENRTHFSVVT